MTHHGTYTAERLSRIATSECKTNATRSENLNEIQIALNQIKQDGINQDALANLQRLAGQNLALSNNTDFIFHLTNLETQI
jgi:hypothetical protein